MNEETVVLARSTLTTAHMLSLKPDKHQRQFHNIELLSAHFPLLSSSLQRFLSRFLLFFLEIFYLHLQSSSLYFSCSKQGLACVLGDNRMRLRIRLQTLQSSILLWGLILCYNPVRLQTQAGAPLQAGGLKGGSKVPRTRDDNSIHWSRSKGLSCDARTSCARHADAENTMLHWKPQECTVWKERWSDPISYFAHNSSNQPWLNG